MAVTKNVYGNYITLSGTLAEIAGALRDEGIPRSKVISIFHDGTNYVAVCHK